MKIISTRDHKDSLNYLIEKDLTDLQATFGKDLKINGSNPGKQGNVNAKRFVNQEMRKRV